MVYTKYDGCAWNVAYDGDGVSSLLLDAKTGMTEEYGDKAKEYKDLKTERAKPKTTEERNAEINNELETLTP